jgi:hypothetical protein
LRLCGERDEQGCGACTRAATCSRIFSPGVCVVIQASKLHISRPLSPGIAAPTLVLTRRITPTDHVSEGTGSVLLKLTQDSEQLLLIMFSDTTSPCRQVHTKVPSGRARVQPTLLVSVVLALLTTVVAAGEGASNAIENALVTIDMVSAVTGWSRVSDVPTSEWNQSIHARCCQTWSRLCNPRVALEPANGARASFASCNPTSSSSTCSLLHLLHALALCPVSITTTLLDYTDSRHVPSHPTTCMRHMHSHAHGACPTTTHEPIAGSKRPWRPCGVAAHQVL